jgi:thiol-disulfide isomerase/thioredoxin
VVQENLPTLNRTPWWRKPWAVGLSVGVLALAGMSFALRLMDTATLPKGPLATLAGKTTDLSTVAAGKPAVVNLWATWCPPCRLELPFLAEAQQAEPGITFIFVDQGEGPATIERYLNAVHLDVANVMLDSGGRIGREIGSTGLPITLFYDSSGRMVDSHLGALSPSMLAGKLIKLRPSIK